MGQVKIINAPTTFTAMWAVMKPWLAKETVDKIDILGSSYESELLQVVDAENLPASLGGTCTCEDCGGCEFSNAGPWLAGRKERREAWLKGERSSIALGLNERPDLEGKEMNIKPEDPKQNGHAVSDKALALTPQAGGDVTPGKEDASEFVEINKEDIPQAGSDAPPAPRIPPEPTSASAEPTKESSPPAEGRGQEQEDSSAEERGQEQEDSSAEERGREQEDSPAEAAARRAARGLAAPIADRKAQPNGAQSDHEDRAAGTFGQVYKASTAAEFREAVVGDDVPPEEAVNATNSDEPKSSMNGILPPGLEPSAPSSAEQPHAVTAPPPTKQAIAGDHERSPSPSVMDATSDLAPNGEANGDAEQRHSKLHPATVASKATKKTKSRISHIVSKVMHPRNSTSMSN
jgi:hypothetical protein